MTNAFHHNFCPKSAITQKFRVGWSLCFTRCMYNIAGNYSSQNRLLYTKETILRMNTENRDPIRQNRPYDTKNCAKCNETAACISIKYWAGIIPR